MDVFRTYAGATPIEGGGHFDTPLSNLAIMAFDALDQGLVADQLFPVVPVGKQSNKYFVMDSNRFRQLPDSHERAPGTLPKLVEFTVSSDSYFAKNYALRSEIPLEYIANADDALNLRDSSALQVTKLLKLGQEVRIAGLVTSITNIGSGVVLSGTNKWSDLANSSPLSDVTTAHAFIQKQTGLIANTAVLDWNTYQTLRRHPELVDFHKFTSGGLLTDAQIAAAFSVERVLVAKATMENQNATAAAETISATNVWGNNCVIAYVEGNAGLQTATAGLRFRWRPEGMGGDMAVQRAVKSGAGERGVEIVQAGYYQDEKIVARDLIYGITATL